MKVQQAAQNSLMRNALRGFRGRGALVPDLKSNADIRLWSARIATGEAARVLAGGTAMAMPTAAQVATALTAYTSADTTQITAKTAYDLGQEAISTQRPTVDALILDLWDTIEYNLRANDPTSLRRKAREWGVTYDNEETEAACAPRPTHPLNKHCHSQKNTAHWSAPPEPSP